MNIKKEDIGFNCRIKRTWERCNWIKNRADKHENLDESLGVIICISLYFTVRVAKEPVFQIRKYFQNAIGTILLIV